MHTNSPDQEFDQAYLTDLVQKALDRPTLRIVSWKVIPLHGGLEGDSAIFRIQGEAKDGGDAIPWSLILKSVKFNQKASEPGGIWYWKREALAYQSGMLHHLPGGTIIAPACYRVEERSDGVLWHWLEDVKDDIVSPWPLEQYAMAARHLGRFNGAYLSEHEFPPETWITHNWLRKYVENASPMIEFVRNDPKHPIVKNMLPGESLALVLAVWDEHDHILDVLENLPQVFCHQDAFRRNLFAKGGRTIAIDWGYMGNAPVGAELVALVAGSIGFFEIPADRVKDMDQLCFEGYLQGLSDAGWQGDAQLVRTAYAFTLMLRYPIGAMIGEMIPKFLDPEARSKVEAAFENKTASELELSDPALVAYYRGIFPEVFKLLGGKN